MNRRFAALVVVLTAVTFGISGAALAGPTDGQIDISGAELAGSAGFTHINVYGTVRCAGAGPLLLDAEVQQASTGGIATGSNAGMTCPAAGDVVKWVVTAVGAGFATDEKVQIVATVAGSTIASDAEEHVLRWGR